MEVAWAIGILRVSSLDAFVGSSDFEDTLLAILRIDDLGSRLAWGGVRVGRGDGALRAKAKVSIGGFGEFVLGSVVEGLCCQQADAFTVGVVGKGFFPLFFACGRDTVGGDGAKVACLVTMVDLAKAKGWGRAIELGAISAETLALFAESLFDTTDCLA